MKTKKILVLITIILSVFQVFCQTGNIIEHPGFNWYHKDMTLNKIPGISTTKAYDELLGNLKSRNIIVAILDDGVDIDHEDLKNNIWVNKNEIPDNGIDDDNNGYIDDIHGWNFLGNAKGENLEFDTWVLTRIYKSLKAKFEKLDTLNLNIEDQIEYIKFIKIRKEFNEERAFAEQMYNQWKNGKKAFDNNIDLIKKYTKEKDINLALLESLEILEDTIAEKACNQLIKWYKSGLNQQIVNMQYNSFRIRYEYKLNPEYDSRSLVGDDPNDLNDRNYGNPDVFIPGQFHGTTVSGVIGATRLNGIGIDGITNNIELMVVRVVPSGDERDKDVANAIYYAVDNGAKILNMSFGKPYSPYKAHVEKAIRYAEERGVLLITGSGNNGDNIDVHPRYPNKYYSDGTECSTWINVGATSWNQDSNLVCGFSNYGKKGVDIMAPGVDILTLFPDEKTLNTEGTSIAAPMVSGVAALIWSYFPELTALEVKDILMESAENFGDREVLLPGSSNKKVLFKDLSKTGGIVNVYNAILLAERKFNNKG